MDYKHIGGGLTPTPEDERDFNFGAVFGMPDLADLPRSYKVSEPLEIKNQYESDMCTAFGATAVSEDQELVTLSPEYQFAMTKKLMGSWKRWGADIRTACKVLTKIGSIEPKRVPLELRLSQDNKNRNEIANWENWPKGIELYAEKHKKQSYFSTHGNYSTFDNMRSVLWQTRKEERSILTGVLWQSQWSSMKRIDADFRNGQFGHAFKVFGWEDNYLIAQLSNGTNVGDNGIFYFNKDIVNTHFTFGGYTFSDMPREEAQFYAEKRARYRRNWLTRILIRLWN